MNLKPLTVETLLRMAIGDAHVTVASRLRGSGRVKWEAEDFDLAVRTLCRSVSKLPAPYPELAEVLLRKHEAASTENPLTA